MLSLQDSVFFEISIKSLLKSWSSSCEYPAKLELMFTFFTWPPDLSPTTRKETLCTITCMRAVKSCSEVSCFPRKRKVVINGVVRMTDEGSPGLFHVYAGCSGSPIFSLVYRSPGSLLSVDLLLLMDIVC